MPKLNNLAKQHGTPLLVIDHKIIRQNYQNFKKHLPRVQIYYAIKANPEPEIIKTIYKLGGSFDVASLQEFNLVLNNIPQNEIPDLNYFIYDKIIIANTIKPIETLVQLAPYKPLVTFDNIEELRKIKKHCPTAGVIVRLKVPNIGSMVELSSKFGVEPYDAHILLDEARKMKLTVEGLSFHVGSQCTNSENYIAALTSSADVLKEARAKGFDKIKILDIGGGFPVNYDGTVAPFKDLARVIQKEINRLFPADIDIVAEPGRFMVANSAILATKIIGKAFREGKTVYYVNDGIYNTLSGIIFDHCIYHFKSFKRGGTSICAVVGPTCDALDSISQSEELPDLKIGDLLYVKDIGAYSCASATNFNGFDKAKIIHINT